MINKIKKTLFKNLLSAFAVILGLSASVLLAVAISGAITTYANGQVLDATSFNASMQALKTTIEGIPGQKSWRLIYENDITTATGSVNVTGLDGNSDVEYMINTKFIGAGGTGGGYYLEFNGDSAACNYKFHHFYIHYTGSTLAHGVPACPTNSGFSIGATASTTINVGSVNTSKTFIYTKSGTKRVGLTEATKVLSASDAWTMEAMQWWENTSSNLTSMRFYYTNGNGIGVGSRIEIWARR